eukprot:7238123-Pyramimonas_sp.AAC.1
MTLLSKRCAKLRNKSHKAAYHDALHTCCKSLPSRRSTNQTRGTRDRSSGCVTTTRGEDVGQAVPRGHARCNGST